jgi:hypothetical protein
MPNQPKGRPTDEFARFRELTKQVVSVPKTEIDRRAAEKRDEKRPTNRSQLKKAARGLFD